MTNLACLAIVKLSGFQRTAVLTVVGMHGDAHLLKMINKRTAGLAILGSETGRLCLLPTITQKGAGKNIL